MWRPNEVKKVRLIIWLLSLPTFLEEKGNLTFWSRMIFIELFPFSWKSILHFISVFSVLRFKHNIQTEWKKPKLMQLLKKTLLNLFHFLKQTWYLCWGQETLIKQFFKKCFFFENNGRWPAAVVINKQNPGAKTSKIFCLFFVQQFSVFLSVQHFFLFIFLIFYRAAQN